MDIYENIVIGNFLFGIGIALGARAGSSYRPSVSINLLQQTPIDPVMGDALLQGSRAMRILEFKRAVNSSQKEIAKRRKLEAMLSGEKWAPLAELSRQVHWYIESVHVEQSLEFAICPYLDFEQSSPSTGPTLQDVISDFADELNTPGPSRSELFRQYLCFLLVAHKSGSVGSGAMIVCMNEKGELNYVAVENLLELSLHLDKYHELNMAREQKILDARLNAIQRQQRSEKEREHGVKVAEHYR